MVESPRSRRSHFLDGMVVLAFAIAATAVVLRTGLRPRDPLAAMAVVFPPWTTTQDAILRATAAGASVVNTGATFSIVVVSPSGPGYVDRVLSQGALLVLDPQVLAFCAPALLSREPSRS